MYIPSATYRVQLNQEFTFQDLDQIVDYLNSLGISTIYASPFLRSRPGSLHGYDGIDPEMIDPEIGTEEEFETLRKKLGDRGMGWLQDIAPNHMAFHHKNRWLCDVLEKGPKSRYYQHFDINWNDSDPKLKDKVMVPFLGGTIEEILSRNEIRIVIEEEGFFFKYFDDFYPLNIRSYELILNQGKSHFINVYESVGTELQRYMSFLAKTTKFAEEKEIVDEEWQIFKINFYHEYKDSHDIKRAIDIVLDNINSDQASLFYLLERQHYVLAHWQLTEKQINYRRFFTINDLICLDINNAEVFEAYHRYLKRLYDKQLIQGLRIDHIDGLFNPGTYLHRLRNFFGEELYIVVEKILEWEEALPVHWPEQGTTGYGFMSTISHLFTDWQNKKKLDHFYQEVIEDKPDYRQLVSEKKYFILNERMGGELNNLFDQMKMLNLMPDDELGLNEEKLKEALAVFLVMHPVYRIYPTQYPLHHRDIGIIKAAYHEAEKWNPELRMELKYLFKLFTEPPEEDQMIAESKLYFLMRCQQFTGPLEAKGVEDTTFYLYNRLISHNEVGDSPEIFGISQQEFHERMIERQLIAPHALNATATHDTKRGEDTRIRINVISELPEQWSKAVRKWREINQQFIKHKDGMVIPEPNDEYFIYQTICGAFPMDGQTDDSFKERIKEYMLKVVREGKQNSSWAAPNQIYEFGVFEFINQILNQENKFIAEATPFIKKITHYGIIYSLAQQILKLTAPGVPDIYQGCELWDLSLVDPDNRRPVDYEQRKNMLSEITESGRSESLIRYLMENKESGNIKLYTIYKALTERNSLFSLFKYGKYIPAVILGDFKNYATGFFRNFKNQWSLTIVPHHLVSFIPENALPLKHIWHNTHLRVPPKAPKVWKNIFTDETYGFDDNMFFKDIFASFPIVFLTGISE
jgi:(1->4)-alpha-D-glucan 1-alpha-D-glucosylmutase